MGEAEGDVLAELSKSEAKTRPEPSAEGLGLVLIAHQ